MYELMEKKVLCSGKFLRFMSVVYKDSSGALRNWETFERVDCDGVVAVVPVTGQGEVFIIRQFRPAVGRYVIEFPAGLNDKGESLEEAARRELLEETGYSAGEMIFLAEGPVSSGASAEILTVFLARGLKFKGMDKRDETEDIEVFKIPVSEVYGRLSAFRMKGDFIDLKVFGLLELAKKHL